jgi:hypothetical protein
MVAKLARYQQLSCAYLQPNEDVIDRLARIANAAIRWHAFPSSKLQRQR